MEYLFITKAGHITLYVKDIQASIRFYTQKFGISDITPDYIPHNSLNTNIIWLGFPGVKPVILLYQVIKPDGYWEETGGYGLDHFALMINKPITDQMADISCVTDHPPEQAIKSSYIQDPDGNIIEVSS